MKKLLALIVACCLVAFLSTPVFASPYFSLDSFDEWDDALGGGGSGGSISPLTASEFVGMYGSGGAGWYPDENFWEAELWAYDASGDPNYDEDGLVMAWGMEENATPDGEYVSAWKYEYGLDPDLTGTTLVYSIIPPQFGPTGMILTVSIGLQDAAGLVRSWRWNCGPGGLAWNVMHTLTINPGLAQNQAGSVAFFDNGYNIVNTTMIVADENAQWSGAVAVPPPGGIVNVPWNYWGQARVVPEPATMILFGSGLLGLFGLARRFRK